MTLPRPVTTTDVYLAAILDKLEQLTQQQEKPESPPGTVELREPAQPTPLPDEFPGAAALRESGYAALEDVPCSRADLLKIHGIGPITADEIIRAL